MEASTEVNEAEIKAAIAEGERVNRIIEAALDCGRRVRVGEVVIVRTPITKFDPYAPFEPRFKLSQTEHVVITPELWARIEARR
jgi:hypothetical protein